MLNIKRIFETIADAGQKILEKKSFKSITKKRDLLDLCDDLLSTKGAAFGITLARDILFRYQNLSIEEKNKFLIQVNQKYKPDPLKIDEAIKKYSNDQDDYSILNLSRVASGIRKELFVRLNMAPNGTSEIVSLREDLLRLLKENPELKSLDYDLIDLFKNWFNPGFIKLRKIIKIRKSSFYERYERVKKKTWER